MKILAVQLPPIGTVFYANRNGAQLYYRPTVEQPEPIAGEVRAEGEDLGAFTGETSNAGGLIWYQVSNPGGTAGDSVRSWVLGAHSEYVLPSMTAEEEANLPEKEFECVDIEQVRKQVAYQRPEPGTPVQWVRWGQIAGVTVLAIGSLWYVGRKLLRA